MAKKNKYFNLFEVYLYQSISESTHGLNEKNLIKGLFTKVRAELREHRNDFEASRD